MWDNSRAHHAFTVERRFPELTVNVRDVAGLGESRSVYRLEEQC